MLRRDFVCAVVSVSFAPRLLLSQQTNPAPPPPAPVPWTLGLNPQNTTAADRSRRRDCRDRTTLFHSNPNGNSGPA